MDDHLDRARQQEQTEPPRDEGQGSGDAGVEVAHPFGRACTKGVDLMEGPKRRNDRKRPKGRHHENEQSGQHVLQGGEGLHGSVGGPAAYSRVADIPAGISGRG